MDGVPLDVCAELLANGSGFGFFRISGAHHFPQLLDGVVGFENHWDDRPFAHEFHKAAEEGTFLMDVVKALSLRLRKMDHLHRPDSKAFLFKLADDRTHVAGFDSIWFKNCECLFHNDYLRLACIASPISAGLFTTRIPAACMAAIFSLAVPFPPRRGPCGVPEARSGRR